MADTLLTFHLWSLSQPCGLGRRIPITQARKLRLIEGRDLVQGHVALSGKARISIPGDLHALHVEEMH